MNFWIFRESERFLPVHMPMVKIGEVSVTVDHTLVASFAS